MDIINKISVHMQNIFNNRLVDVIIVVVLLILFNMLSSAISYIIIKIFNIKEKDKTKIKSNAFYKPIKVFFRILPIYLAFVIFKVSFMENVNLIFRIIIILLITNGVANLFNGDSLLIQKLIQSDKVDKNEKSIVFLGKLMKGIIYIISAYIIFAELGYNLSGIITGIGLGSVVIALAAQDIAKNIFAGISIFLDRPFEIGDYIECGNYKGTVEDIKFRSTKLRTVENTLVTIPNETIATNAVNNLNLQEEKKRRFSVDLGLCMNTPSSKIEKITNRIKFALENDKDVIKGSVVVAFDKITQDSMNIHVYLYTEIVNYIDYLAFSQRINTIIMEIVEKEEIDLAYPSQDIYIKNIDELK